MPRASILLFVALALPAWGAEETAAWDLGDEKLRYDHKPGEPPEGASDPQVAEHQLLGQADFGEGRRPKLGVSRAGDLVWHYALRVPRLPGGKHKKGRPITIEVEERFPLASGEFKVTGNHSVRIKGRRWQIRSSLLISRTKPTTFKQGNLVVTRRFDAKKGRLQLASYQFEIESLIPGEEGKTRRDTWTGRIEPKRPVRVLAKDFHLQVQQAIERGSEWLKRATTKRLNSFKAATQPSHQRLGQLSLPLFALLRSGVSPRELVQHFEWCAQQPLEATYSVSLWVMALEALAVKRTALPPRARTRSVTRFDRGQLGKKHKELMRRAVRWLIATRKKGEGWWSYYASPLGEEAPAGTLGPFGHDHKTVAKNGDRSNSQFAVLALHSALASGIDVPGEVWLEVTREALGSQAKKGPGGNLSGSLFGKDSPFSFDARDLRGDPNQTMERVTQRARTIEVDRGKVRGWSYGSKRRPNGGAYGSMTAAGVSTLAICREGLERTKSGKPKLEERLLRSLRDGLCWMLENYDVTQNPRRGATWYYYYAYSLEKAMDTAGVERLGAREWWRDIAAELLARQDDRGSWGESIESTSFSLLVLNRATLPAKLEIGEAERVKSGGNDPSLWDRVVVEGVGQLQLRDLLAAMAETPDAAAERLELAQKALAALDPAARPRLVPELQALVEHRHKATRKWAREVLEGLAGTLDPKGLERFLARWEGVRLAGEALDYDKLALLREVVRDPKSPLPLLEHALLVIGRLRAVEAVEDLTQALESKDFERRKLVWPHLVGLVDTGYPDYEPSASQRVRQEQLAAWRAWWKSASKQQVRAEQVRRWVRDLGYPGRTKAAEKALVGVGKPAVRPLIDALRTPSSRESAHRVLRAITGQKLAADVRPWLEWWEKQEQGK